MTGAELRAARRAMQLDELGLARLIGYTGTDRNDVTRVKEYERGKRQIPLYIAKLVWLAQDFWFRHGHHPRFPDWPGYDFDHSADPQPQGSES